MRADEVESIGRRAEDDVASLFKADGWAVEREPSLRHGRPDLVIKKKNHAYIVEVKAVSEGRSDRVLALLSQAILQAQAYARNDPMAAPLAIVWVGTASPALLKKVDDFRRAFASDIAIGLISGDGVRYFLGSGLHLLNANPVPVHKHSVSQPRQAYNLFSDLNQWMLKVLLAPEVPEHLLAAPRSEYRNVSELAGAAEVSMMSAFRFATRLREEGFLDESGPHLRLVRRAALFRRWQSAAQRSSPEAPMRFLIPGAGDSQLRKLVSSYRACLGLFAAADALGLGHVAGVPPYVYVPRISKAEQRSWKELVPAGLGEQPHLIVKQALAPESLFRAAVVKDGMRVADVLQVWLDVSSHPSRGAEQAEVLRRKVLYDIIGDDA
jgi:hypothetical protein